MLWHAAGWQDFGLSHEALLDHRYSVSRLPQVCLIEVFGFPEPAAFPELVLSQV